MMRFLVYISLLTLLHNSAFAGFQCGALLSKNTHLSDNINVFKSLGLKYTSQLIISPEIEPLIQPEDLTIFARYEAQVLRLLGYKPPSDIKEVQEIIAKKLGEYYEDEIFLNAQVKVLLSAFFGLVYKDKIKRAYVAPVIIKKIDEVIGYGAYSLNDVKSGDFLGEYTGAVHALSADAKPHESESSNQAYSFAYPVNMFTKAHVDASEYGNFTRFVNHSYSPNVDFYYVNIEGRLRIIFIANEDIKKGDELFINYGPSYWSKRSDLSQRERNNIEAGTN